MMVQELFTAVDFGQIHRDRLHLVRPPLSHHGAATQGLQYTDTVTREATLCGRLILSVTECRDMIETKVLSLLASAGAFHTYALLYGSRNLTHLALSSSNRSILEQVLGNLV